MGVADMAGYDIEEIYRLEWPDTRPGAVVRARSIGTGEMLAWSAKHAMAVEAPDQREAMFLHTIEFLAHVIVDWTLERRGRPLPVHDVSEAEAGLRERAIDTNIDSLTAVGHRFLMDIYSAYMGATVEVPVDSDLGKGSNSGGSSPAELQTMEALSYSPPNSDMPEPS